MEIIKKDSKLYLKVYLVSPTRGFKSCDKKERAFNDWDKTKEYLLKLLPEFPTKGTLYKRKAFGELEEVPDFIEPTESIRVVDCFGWVFKPNEEYAREKWIYIETILAEITPEELNELRSLSL